MLGLLNLLFLGGVATVEKVKENQYNSKSRNDAIKRRNIECANGEIVQNTYLDSNGRERDINTNHPMLRWRDAGDDYLVDTVTNERRNLSQEKRDIVRRYSPVSERKGAIARFNRTRGKYRYHIMGAGSMYESSLVVDMGSEWIDNNTGEVYYLLTLDINCKEYNGRKYGTQRKMSEEDNVSFYMNQKGMLVGKSDYQIELERRYPHIFAGKDNKINNFIKRFNVEQAKGGYDKRTLKEMYNRTTNFLYWKYYMMADAADYRNYMEEDWDYYDVKYKKKDKN